MSTICMCTFLFMQLIDLSYSSEHMAYQVHQSDRPETFLLGFFVIIQYTTFGRCNWCVFGACSLSSPYMLYSDVSILAPRSKHVPDISVPPLTIYIW